MSIGGHESPVAKTTTWLTPKAYLDALGPFDFDPCAAPEPRPWPTAREHNVLPSDGLTVPWKGRVWLNPPYGKEAAAFMARMVRHGNGTALIFARTETEWFGHAWCGTAMLFPKRRITFCTPDGRPGPGNSGAPSVFVAYGGYDAQRLRDSGIEGRYVDLRHSFAVRPWDEVFA